MRLSETPEEALPLLTPAQKDCIFGTSWDDGLSYDAALVLGGRLCRERAASAAALWQAGRVKKLIPTGGVEWDVDGEKISEAHQLTRYLKEAGVPEEAILIENQATTTVENMLFGTIVIERNLRIHKIRRVCVVSSDWLLRRLIPEIEY